MNAQTDDNRRTDWSVVPAALAVGLGLGVAGWWLTNEDPSEEVTVHDEVQVSMASPPRAGVPGLGALTPDGALPVASGPSEHAGATGSFGPGAPMSVGHPGGKPAAPDHGGPVQAPVREKPGFLTAQEWEILTNAAAQSSNPDEELARLVNQLRYHKLTHEWRNAPQNVPGGLGLRARLAKSLLDDLMPRLVAGDVDVAEARRLLPELLADAVPNPVERTQLAQILASEINQLQGLGSAHATSAQPQPNNAAAEP